MARILVVSGLIPSDAGKTWFTLGLVEALKQLNLNTTVYKPIAGHNLWFSPRTLLRSFDLKLLVGNDVLAYYERGLIHDITRANPVALALAPRNFLTTSRVDEYLESFEDITRTLVLARFTNCDNNSVKHIVIRENLDKTPPLLRSIIEELAITLNSINGAVNDVLSYMRSRDLILNLEKCLEDFSSRVDIVIVESFNDAVVPFSSLLDKVSSLLIVTPGHVFLYDNIELVRRTINKTISILGDEGYRAKYLVEYVKPIRIFNTEFLTEPRVSQVHLELARIIMNLENTSVT